MDSPSKPSAPSLAIKVPFPALIHVESSLLKPPIKSGCLFIDSHIQSSSLSEANPANIIANSSTVFETVGNPQPSFATLTGSQFGLFINLLKTFRNSGNQSELGNVYPALLIPILRIPLSIAACSPEQV